MQIPASVHRLVATLADSGRRCFARCLGGTSGPGTRSRSRGLRIGGCDEATCAVPLPLLWPKAMRSGRSGCFLGCADGSQARDYGARDGELVAAPERDGIVVAPCSGTQGFAEDERALFAAVGSGKAYRTVLLAEAPQIVLARGVPATDLSCATRERYRVVHCFGRSKARAGLSSHLRPHAARPERALPRIGGHFAGTRPLRALGQQVAARVRLARGLA